ncbi:MAG: arsenate reductase (glutaredoxin) [Campylobacterales bacterium]|nr:arsenate reductase (glutaredoxin) [Campylobacterales bacterium]
MSDITIWHNNRCGKSRDALKMLQSKGIEPTVVKYLETDLSVAKIKEILAMLGMKPRELMRTKEAIYKELNLKDEHDNEKLIEAMVANPKLIERPIIIKGNQALLGRPIEKLAAFLD